jgi:uncharacterized membrane protein
LIFRSPQALYFKKKIEEVEEKEVQGQEVQQQLSAFEEGKEQIEKTELEFWKFAKRQMGLFVNLSVAIGVITTAYGFGAHFLMFVTIFNTIFTLDCDDKDPTAWKTHGLPDELYIGANMMFTMFYITLYYVLYWIIPYAYNQVAKT